MRSMDLFYHNNSIVDDETDGNGQAASTRIQKLK